MSTSNSTVCTPQVNPVTSGAGPQLVRNTGLTVADAIDAYMRVYAGRDPALAYRLTGFAAVLGAERALVDVTDDDVFHALKQLAAQPGRYYAGRDADGKAIHKARGKRSGPTINRYQQAFASLCSWVMRQRLVPKGWSHPCKGVEQRKEHPGRVRFLDDDERARLLDAVKFASWPRLYLLTLLALTTGARRGELERLTWGDVDLQRATASVDVTKNGARKVLPLLPAVLELLRCFRSQDARRFSNVSKILVFHSPRRPDSPFDHAPAWRKALEKAKVKDFRFHDLRHSCASYLAQHGASLLEIADVLGHKQLRMTQRYSHLTVGTKAALVNRVLGDIR